MTTQHLSRRSALGGRRVPVRGGIEGAPANASSMAGLGSVTGFMQVCVSNALAQSFGQRIQGIAVAWVVLEITDSKLWMGVINGLPTISIVLFSLLGGVLADSWNPRRIMVLTRVMLAITTMAAAILVSTGRVEVSHLLLYVWLIASIAAIDMPASRTLVHRLVGSSRLLGASAAQSVFVNLVNVAAPVSIGLLIGVAGLSTAFWLMGAGYTIAVLLVLVAKVDAEVAEPRHLSPLTDVVDAFAYIQRTPAVAALLALGFLVPVAGVYFAMVPMFARDVLEIGPGGLGLLVASFSAGSLSGSVYLALNRSPRRRGLRLTQLGTMFGVGMMAFALSQSFLLSCGISFLLGVTAGFWQNMLSAMVQTVTTPEMRGRVVSVFTMAFQLLGIGWLAAGTLASLFGNVATLLGAGALFTLLSLAVFASSRATREID